MSTLTLNLSGVLIRLLEEISARQAQLIGADPSQAYLNYYLDVASHLQALHPVGTGLGIGAGMSVLEVGSGIGTRCLLGTGIFGARFTGLEPCLNSYSTLGRVIEEMKVANPHFDYRYVNRGGEDTGLPSESFDVILSFEVMEHVKAPDQVILEMYRLLKPGGKLFISTCNYDSFYEGHYRSLWLPFLNDTLKRAYIGLRGYNREFLKELNFLTKRELLGYLAGAGFAEVTAGLRFASTPPPQLLVNFPRDYAPEPVRPRKSIASRWVQNRSVHAFLARFDREYKIYIEARK